ncbi:YgxA [Bacillus freudenreichii]|nr:YgxA [Bacillus freudenreichii]
MEELFRPIVNYFASRPTTKAVLLVDCTKEILTAKDMFDVIIYAVASGQENQEQARHFYLQGMNIGLYIVDESLFRSKPFQLNDSEVLFERDRFIDKIKEEIPSKDIKLKMGLEFAKLIQAYTTGKDLFNGGQFLDAYEFLVKSLNHLARLTLIEKGAYIDSALWKQIKCSEPEILKLFEELVTSEEPIGKRLELVFLASGFLIYSKTIKSTEHLLEVLDENPIWKYEMFEQHPQIKCYGANLRTLLDYLIEKGLIVPLRIESSISGMYEQCYKVKKTC